MRTTVIFALLTSLALDACGGPATSVKPGSHAVAASPRPVASKAAASPTPAPIRRLQAPPGTTALAGTIAIDAAYAVSVSGGAVFQEGQGTVLGAGQLSAVAAGLASAGGQLIADSGANIISNHAGGLLSDGGGGLIANNAGNLVSDHGGGLIANNAGNLTGKTKLHLLADAALAPGSQLPAAGMIVQAQSLRTHQLLTIGQDEAGQPVDTIYSNAAGAFKLYVPAEESGNVLVTASVPGTSDTRLLYGLLTAADAAAPLDETHAVATRFIRAVLINRLLVPLKLPPATGEIRTADGNDAAINALLGPFLARVQAAAKAANAQLTDDQAASIATRAADDVLSAVALDQVKTFKSADWDQPEEPALQAVYAVLDQMADGAAVTLAKDPHAFDDLVPQQAQAVAAMIPRDPSFGVLALPKFQILKPADVSDFLMRGTLAIPPFDGVVAMQDAILGRCNLPDADLARRHLAAGGYGVLAAVAAALIGSQELQDQVVAEISAAPPAP